MARPALIVVDVQRDFCPRGSLAVRHGDEVVPRLNGVIEAFQKAKLPIYFTRDWHPPNHCSFRGRGGNWPPHCVRDTPGAEFHPDLVVPQGATIISKGIDPDSEAYSGFEGTDLAKRLRKDRVTEVFLGGLATDYCVKESSLDALELGFQVNVMKDCVMGVNLKRSDSAVALRAMVNHGARLGDSLKAIRSAQQ